MKIIDLAECLVTLKKILGEQMLAASEDTQAEIADCAPIHDAFRKLAGDIVLEGEKQRPDIKGANGTVDAAPTSASAEKANGDKRASDHRLAFDKRGNLRHSASAIFSNDDNASRYAAPHSIDSIFSKG